MKKKRKDSGSLVTAYLIKKEPGLANSDTSRWGDFYHTTAFKDKAAAGLRAEELGRIEGWKAYELVAVTAEEISGGRIIYGRSVYDLNVDSEEETLRRIALSKLTEEEKAVLGISGGE